MSYIFDALQKSESERSGVDKRALAAATELLQSAERQAAAQRDAVVTAGQAARLAAVADPDEMGAVDVQAASDSPIEPSVLEAEVFARFKSLAVSVPAQNRLVSFTDRDSLAAEKFRFLAVRVRQMRHKRPLKKVLVTSSVPQEGKSMVAANLACTLARRAKQKTLLLDGDLRRPSLSNIFGLGKIPGICEWLQGDTGPAESIYNLEEAGLWILPAGSTPRNPLELMQSGKLSGIMEQLTTWFDWIVVDTPPVLPLADTSVWMRMADGVLLVARQGTAEKRQLQRGLEVIERSKLIGALLNCSSNTAHNNYYYHYKPQSSSSTREQAEQ